MTREYLGRIKLGSVASMTQTARWAFLERNHEIALSTVDKDGVIYSSPVWYTVKDKRIFLPIDQASKHLKNMENGSSMTGVVFKGGDEFATARGVQIQGRGEVVKDPGLAKECADRVADKVFGPGHPHKPAYVEYRECFDNMTMELIPNKMITWDLRKLYNVQAYAARSL
ncbi:MAG: pyridoxamine 5'-phosphate oxidase family protein [Gammaproteobacteria bacterium]|nr:pyridoxamine 5'-phosphate oxidase family protein [Gammaproteobacteria bacterium]